MPIPDALSWLARFESGQYKPITFLERGATLPFTTPYLLGGRIRPGARGGAELVLANPAGMEGVYILPWGALPDMCAPTLHDRALWDRVAALPQIGPRAVRAASRQVAAEGHAGRPAARAAAGALAAAEAGRAGALRQLLRELVRRGEPAGLGGGETGAVPALERRARAVLQRLCADGALAPNDALLALEQLAGALELYGLPGNPTGAPLPLLAAAIGRMVDEVTAWAEGGSGADRGFARLLRDSAALTLDCHAALVARLDPMLADPWALIRHWRRDPVLLLDQLARLEWLLDGWELVTALWRQALPAGRAAAIRDIAALIPVIPAEANDWMAQDVTATMTGHQDGFRQWRKLVQANQDWLTGTQLGLIARNEALRALAA